MAASSRLNRLLAAAPETAAREARAALAVRPGDPQARLLLGAALRRCSAFDEAVGVLASLADDQPEVWGAYYEAGVALAALGHVQPAIEALTQAVGLNPRAALASFMLGALRPHVRQAPEISTVEAEALPGYLNDARLVAAVSAFFKGEEGAAAALAERFNLHPSDLAAVLMLAEAGLRLDRADAVAGLLAPWRNKAPDCLLLRYTFARVLRRQHRISEALEETGAAVALAPKSVVLRTLNAALLAEASDYDGSLQAYGELLQDHPGAATLWLGYGHVLRAVGRQAKAIAAYRRAIVAMPDWGEAYWSLANLKVAPFELQDIPAMQAILQRTDLGVENRAALHYALGRALENQGAFAAAFEQYTVGAQTRGSVTPWDADAHHRFVVRNRAVFTTEALRRRTGWGSPSSTPIFVVGLPRSGSTLVEQILSSHSQVEGLSELPHLTALADGLTKRRSVHPAPYPELLLDLTAPELKAFGDAYLERSGLHRRLGRPHFVDKLPGNVWHIGLILLALPNARVIDVRRDPISCCLSLYKQLFAEGQGYSYDWDDLARYYADYVAITAHFDAVAPGRVLQVRYEDLVRSPTAEIARMTGYCGLGFEEGCLEFHLQDRPVRTASSEQVRRPLDLRPLEHWKGFEVQLVPLRTALAAHLGSAGAK